MIVFYLISPFHSSIAEISPLMQTAIKRCETKHSVQTNTLEELRLQTEFNGEENRTTIECVLSKLLQEHNNLSELQR